MTTFKFKNISYLQRQLKKTYTTIQDLTLLTRIFALEFTNESFQSYIKLSSVHHSMHCITKENTF